MRVTIYHNPDCGTSRNTLAILPVAQKGSFTKAGGGQVIDSEGRRLYS